MEYEENLGQDSARLLLGIADLVYTKSKQWRYILTSSICTSEYDPKGFWPNLQQIVYEASLHIKSNTIVSLIWFDLIWLGRWFIFQLRAKSPVPIEKEKAHSSSLYDSRSWAIVNARAFMIYESSKHYMSIYHRADWPFKKAIYCHPDKGPIFD